MAYILAILWGLVQGLTEILPVSGSAHMAILERVLGQTAARTEQRFFYGLLDLALAAAVLIAYRQELAAIIRAFSQKPTRAADRSVRQAGRERRRLVLLLAVGLLPLLLEILLQRWTAALYTKPLVWAAFLALGGLVLFLSTARTGGEKDARQMRLPDALLIGAACGLVLDFGSLPSPPQTACFCLPLLVCRMADLRRTARAAAFAGLYFLCVLVWGGEHAGWTLGVAAGALLACLLPPLPEHPAAEARAAAPDALDQAADVLLALEARVSPALPEPQTAPALIFDSAASAVCRSCVRQQLCWQERADETYRLLCGCAGTILRQGQAREGDLPPAFCSACIRAEAFREAVNQALRTQQAELLAFRRSEESRQIACALLGHLARFVGAAGRRPKAQGAPRWRLSLGVRAVGLRGDTLSGRGAAVCAAVRRYGHRRGREGRRGGGHFPAPRDDHRRFCRAGGDGAAQ